MVVQSAAQGRLEEFFRNRSKGGLTITCEGGKWSARAEAAMGAVGSTGRWTTTITVADPPWPFEASHRPPYATFLTGDLSAVHGVVDIRQCRLDRIVPLPAQVRAADGSVQVFTYVPPDRRTGVGPPEITAATRAIADSRRDDSTSPFEPTSRAATTLRRDAAPDTDADASSVDRSRRMRGPMSCEGPAIPMRRLGAAFPALRQLHRRFDGEPCSPIDGQVQLRGAVRIPSRLVPRPRRPVSCNV